MTSSTAFQLTLMAVELLVSYLADSPVGATGCPLAVRMTLALLLTLSFTATM